MLPVFGRFRAGFSGKASPVQLWWGSFDLAVSRFSGRKAPQHPGGVPGLPDRITREAYSHEVTSAGFWAAGVLETEPFFYSYIYPEPDGYRATAFAMAGLKRPMASSFCPTRMSGLRMTLRDAERVLPVDVRGGADLAKWDRVALEREPVAP